MKWLDLDFYRGKRVFLTGHTGFKGNVDESCPDRRRRNFTGYSLEPPTEPNVFKPSGVEQQMTSMIGDVRDAVHLKQAFEAAQPEIVLHLGSTADCTNRL